MKMRTAAVLVSLVLAVAGCGTTSTSGGGAEVDTGAKVDTGADLDVEDLPRAIHEDFEVKATARQVFNMIKHAGGDAVSDHTATGGRLGNSVTTVGWVDSRAPYPEGGAVFVCHSPKQADRLADLTKTETGDYAWTAGSNVMLAVSKHLSQDEADRYLHAFEDAVAELRQ